MSSHPPPPRPQPPPAESPRGPRRARLSPPPARTARRERPSRFRDRATAGRQLAEQLAGLGAADPVVMALPRGGVPVAVEVATALVAPLDVLVVRKLGMPGQPELAMGAVGEGGVQVLQHDVLDEWPVDERVLEAVAAAERRELDRRVRLLRGDRPALPVGGRTVVVVDDGVATGSTARAAAQVLRARGADRLVLAVPVAPADTVHALAGTYDEVVCLRVPAPFLSVGTWYDDFSQLSDEDVRAALDGMREAGEAAR